MQFNARDYQQFVSGFTPHKGIADAQVGFSLANRECQPTSVLKPQDEFGQKTIPPNGVPIWFDLSTSKSTPRCTTGWLS